MQHTLTLALAASLMAIGTGAIIAPRFSSRQYGLPTDDPAALAFVRATGARDVIVGVAIANARRDTGVLRATLTAAAWLGIADAVAVASVRGLRPQHVIHLGGAIALFGAAALVPKTSE